MDVCLLAAIISKCATCRVFVGPYYKSSYKIGGTLHPRGGYSSHGSYGGAVDDLGAADRRDAQPSRPTRETLAQQSQGLER